MKNLTRILAVIVMVISILVLVLSLAGVVGTWIVRGGLAGDLERVATAAEARATIVKGRLDRVDTVLTRAQDQLARVEQDVQAFGSDLDQNRPLLAAISDKLGLELGPLFDSVREIMTTVREAVAAINSAAEAINAIPFVSVPVPSMEKADKLSQDVESLRTQVRDLRAAIDAKRSEIIGGAVSVITTPTAQIGSILGEMQATVSVYSQEVGALQERLSNFAASIERWLTWLAVILTLILLWFALSQAGLLVLGWRLYSGRDLLARDAKEELADADASPAES